MAQRHGYAADVTGGLNGKVYVVDTLNDSGPGSLRDAADYRTQGVPLWIVFRVSGTITLRSPITIGADKTIDGRDTAITLTQNGLDIDGAPSYGSKNIIIEDITFLNIADPTGANGNPMLGIARSSDIWVDHDTFNNVAYPSEGDSRIENKMIAITRAQDDPSNYQTVTVSWNLFENQNKVMIIGDDSYTGVPDYRERVTLDHNFFDGTLQRNPRVSQGYVHMYDNIIIYQNYGIAVQNAGRVRAESNWLEPTGTALGSDAVITAGFSFPDDPSATESEGYITIPQNGDSANIALNGASWSNNHPELVDGPGYAYTLWPANDCNLALVKASAGYFSGKTLTMQPCVQ